MGRLLGKDFSGWGDALPLSIRIGGLGGLLEASDRQEQEALFISRARGDENARLGFYVENVIFWVRVQSEFLTRAEWRLARWTELGF